MLKIIEDQKILGLLRCQTALKFTVILFFATKVDENLEKSKNLLKFWKKLTQFFKNSIKIFSKTQKCEKSEKRVPPQSVIKTLHMTFTATASKP